VTGFMRLMIVFDRNRSQVFTSKCGLIGRSSSSSRYHEVNKREGRDTGISVNHTDKIYLVIKSVDWLEKMYKLCEELRTSGLHVSSKFTFKST